MDTLFKLLNNSAFMGIVGLVSGGLITILGGFFQSVYNNRHVEKMRVLEISHKQKMELKERKECAYRKFLVLRGLFLTLQTIQNDKVATVTSKQEAASLFSEKFKVHLCESPEIFAELDLYGDPDIAAQCGEFSYKYALYQNEQFDEMSQELGEIVELMRKDLAENVSA